MSPLNKKANQDDHMDRISELPSNVIDGILEHLDIRDRVRTSILSTKWRYLWTYVPTLCFEDFFDEYEHLVDPSPVVSKIITDVLMRHNGPISKFVLLIPPEYNFKITIEHLDTWVPLLTRRGIKYLDLGNHGTHLDQMPYIVLSCKELTCLKFAGFNLSIPPNFVGFKRLLKLHLNSVTFESSALESLISSCPLLEELSIEYCNGFEYLDFSAPSLKVLLLDHFDENMESICLKKAKNLIDLTLIAMDYWESGMIKSLPKNMQRFSIGSNYNNEILYADIIPPSLLKSSFNSLKYLKLDEVNLNERRELLYIVSVLKSAPCLVELVVKSFNLVCITQVPDCSEELECSRYCLHRLQTVNICIIYSTQHAMSLIRFILANSTSLETLTFKVGRSTKKLDAPMLASISQDLLWMERASPRAHVKFLPSL